MGEDFEHLLSGMRAIQEATDFLELRDGNRMGHATAIGIDPDLWLGRMPPRLSLRLGDHLDNRLSAWRLRHLDPLQLETLPTSNVRMPFYRHHGPRKDQRAGGHSPHS